jgi:hypothetical protein
LDSHHESIFELNIWRVKLSVESFQVFFTIEVR